MKSYKYYGAEYEVRIAPSPGGHYEATKRTKNAAEKRHFNLDYIFDGVDDGNRTKRSAARRFIMRLFS